MASWHIDIFNKCRDLRNLMIYEQDCLRKCKISTLCNCFYVCFLSGENKTCSSAKQGVGLCISSYKTKYLRQETQTLVLYSSIQYMFVKPNLKRFETNSEQSLN